MFLPGVSGLLDVGSPYHDSASSCMGTPFDGPIRRCLATSGTRDRMAGGTPTLPSSLPLGQVWYRLIGGRRTPYQARMAGYRGMGGHWMEMMHGAFASPHFLSHWTRRGKEASTERPGITPTPFAWPALNLDLRASLRHLESTQECEKPEAPRGGRRWPRLM